MAHAFLIHGGDDGQTTANAKGGRASLTYRVVQAGSRLDAILSVHAERPATFFDVLTGKTLVYDALKWKHVVAETYEVNVEYVDPDEQEQQDENDQTDAPEWFFDIGTTETHITHGYEVVKTFPAGANVETLFGGAINVEHSDKGARTIRGIDVQVPVFTFGLTVKRPAPTNVHELARQLARAAAKTNKTTWYGFEPGEVLFRGCKIRGKFSEKWTFDYLFAASENITEADGMEIKNLGKIAKRGWDYFWAFFTPTMQEADGTKFLVASPRYGFTHRIYREFDFHQLGIGG